MSIVQNQQLVPRRELLHVCTPSIWSEVNEEEVKLVKLDQYSNEYLSVKGLISKSFSVKFTRIERVQNPCLWGCYQLKKLEYIEKLGSVNEMKVFHCTSAINVPSIVKDNLDWRRTTRCKFGQGVSFSPCAEYANRYANNRIGYNRAMIVTKILVGISTTGGYGMVIPPPDCDTSTGNRINGGPAVYVKYNDFEYYPEYVAYYEI